MYVIITLSYNHYVLLDFPNACRNQQTINRQEATRLSVINQAGSEEVESTAKMLRETERALENSRAECQALEERYIYYVCVHS